MTEYSRMAKGVFTSTGALQVINLPFVPDRVEIENITAYSNFAVSDVPWARWDNDAPQGFAWCGYVGTGPVLQVGVINSGGISTFQGGLSQQFGAKQQIVAIPKASPTVVQVTAHGYSVGDTVIMGGLYQSPTTGMQQIAGIPFTITAVGDANHFTINWDTTGSNYTALAASPAGAFVMKVLYPFLYLPEDNYVDAITLGTTTTVQTTMYHNFQVGQEIAFRIPQPYGTTQLNSLPNVVIPGSPIYGYVVSVTDNWTFVCSINSSAYTAFNVNQPFANFPGLQHPQVLGVGDVNTGGQTIYPGSPLYPSPLFPTSTNRVPTINGPAIQGAFVNNTSQGFIIGTGSVSVAGGGADASSHLVGESMDIIEWVAYLDDISM
jgi:hypothetical protein